MENSSSDFDCTTSAPSMSSRENLFWDSDSLPQCPCVAANCSNFTRHRQWSFVCSSCSRLTSSGSSYLSRDSAAASTDDRQTPPDGRILDDESDTNTSAHYYGDDDDTYKSATTGELKASSNNNATPPCCCCVCCCCRRSFRCPQQQRSSSRSSSVTSESLGWESATLVRSISSLTDHIADDRFFSEVYHNDAGLLSATIPEQRRNQVTRRLARCPAAAPRSRSADAVKRLSAAHRLQQKSGNVQETNSKVSSSGRFYQIKTLYRDKTYTCLSTLTAQENADAFRSECDSRDYKILCGNNSNTVFFDHCVPLGSRVKWKEWRIHCNRLPRDHVETIHICRDCRDKTLCNSFEHRDRRGTEKANRKVRWSRKADYSHSRRRQNTQTMDRSGRILSDRRSSDVSLSSSDCDDIRRLTLSNPCSAQPHCSRRYIDTCAITTDESKEDVCCECRCSVTSIIVTDERNQFDYFEEIDSEEIRVESELLFSDELYVESFEYAAIIQPLKFFVGKASISTEVYLGSLRPSSLVIGNGPLSELESEKIALDAFSRIPSTTLLNSNESFEPNFRTPSRGRRKSSKLVNASIDNSLAAFEKVVSSPFKKSDSNECTDDISAATSMNLLLENQENPTLTVYSGSSPITDDSEKLNKTNATIVANELEIPSITTTSVEYMANVIREPSMETLDSKEFQGIEPYLKAQLTVDAYSTATTTEHLLLENQESAPRAQSIASIEPVYAKLVVIDNYSRATTIVHLLLENQVSLQNAQSIASIKPVYAKTSEVDDPSMVRAVVIDNAPRAMGKVMSSPVIESLEYQGIPQLEYIVGKASISTEVDLESLRPNSLIFGVSPLMAATAMCGNQENLPDAQSITSIEPVYAATSEVDDPSLVNAVIVDNTSAAFERNDIWDAPSIHLLFENQENLPDVQSTSIEPVYAVTSEVDDPSLVNAVVINNVSEAMCSSSAKGSDSLESVTNVAVPVNSTRLHQREDSNSFGLKIGYFTSHPKRHLIPTKKDPSICKRSNNKTEEVAAAEDLDIPEESFTDASKIWTLSSDFIDHHLEQIERRPPESHKALMPDEKEDPNLSCLKELLILTKKDQKTPPCIASARQKDRPCRLLPDSVFGRRKAIQSLNNALAQNYGWSAVTHLLSRPADSATADDYRCTFRHSHDRRKLRCKCLRCLSRKAIYNDQTSDSIFNQNNFPEESTDRSNLSNMSSTLACCRTRPDSDISDDCSCHYRGLMLSEEGGEREEMDTITTIYTRLPASTQLKPPVLPRRCPLLPLPESHIPSSSGRHMRPAAEFDASCNQSDDIISSTIIASRKRHRKREVCDDVGRQSREKYYERKYKTLKHFCIKEFGRTKALLETLQFDDE